MQMMRLARRALVAGLAGAVTLGGAYAGVGLSPVPLPPSEAPTQSQVSASSASATGTTLEGGAGLRAGAAKVSIDPRPEDYDGVWETENCQTLNPEGIVEHVADTRSPLPENPNCLYMFSIGPTTPIASFDEEYGLWSRSVAVGDGEDVVVLTILDAFSYMGEFDSFCDDCGAFQIAEELGAEFGVDPAGFFFASSHSHAAPDMIGSGGGVPDWYHQQVGDALRESARAAIEAMRPATLEAGEVLAREFNNERRDTYRSTEDPSLTWFRALDEDGEVIATVGAYAAHPVTFGTNGGVAHADWPALFNASVEERFGGLGLMFQTGLGNMSATSPVGPRNLIGLHLAELVPSLGSGIAIEEADVKVAQHFWDHPVTNPVILGLGGTGVFDRAIGGPATITTGKDPEAKPCTSAGPISVRTAVSAARIGPLVVTGAPGEVFSNLTNTIKEKAGGVALPLAQVNDGLGYIMQEFEGDFAGPARLGFEYEETLAVDYCMGDQVLEATLDLLAGF